MMREFPHVSSDPRPDGYAIPLPYGIALTRRGFRWKAFSEVLGWPVVGATYPWNFLGHFEGFRVDPELWDAIFWETDEDLLTRLISIASHQWPELSGRDYRHPSLWATE